MPHALRGQSSGDFKETSARLQLFHVVTRNSMGVLAADAFTQATPSVITTPAAKSTTLAGISKVGVLGGSVAFTRGGANNTHGGPTVTAGPTYSAAQKPLGLFLNDAVGNAFENTPGIASGRGPYVTGSGSCVGVSIYETQNQTSNAALTWAVGDKVFASVNGLLTNLVADAYERRVASAADTDVTLMGIVKAIPDATNPWLVIDLRVLGEPDHDHCHQRSSPASDLGVHQDGGRSRQACCLDDPAPPFPS